MRVQNTRDIHSDQHTTQTQSGSPPSAPSTVNVLVSAGKTVTWTFGWGVWKCASFFFRSSWWLIVRVFAKRPPEVAPVDLTDLSTPQKFHKVFSESPFSVIKMLLDLIHDHPTTAEKVLGMVAADYEKNREKYTPYQGNEKQCYGYRKKWIMDVDEIVTLCILTQKQGEIDKKVLMWDMEGDESAAISAKDDEYNPSKYTEKAREFRRQYKEIEACKKEFAELWATLFSQLSFDDDLSYLDLDSDDTIVTPIPKEGKTFGVFLERLIYKMDNSGLTLYKLTNFKNQKTFDRWAKYTAEKLKFLHDHTQNAQLKLFCNRLLSILEDQEKRTTLFNITGRVIGVLRPPGWVPGGKVVKKK
ncbi:MAG: hypothetical protein JSS30_00770 [Verrucomicrobia bacterium]|nr:hypothetical protein [Verrucomicrobiota bacterium]